MSIYNRSVLASNPLNGVRIRNTTGKHLLQGPVTVLDGHPATLSWLGGVRGHRVASLGVEHFGQSGRVAQLYEYYGLDAAAILHAAGSLVQGRPIRYLRAIS